MKKTKTKDPYHLKLGKFKKKSVYDVKVDMGHNMNNFLLSLGKQVITNDQYIGIGFNYALIKGLGEAKKLTKK